MAAAVVSVLAVTGAVTGTVLATAGAKPAVVSGVPAHRSAPAPAAPAKSTDAVVPMLGASVEGAGRPIPVPVAQVSTAAASPSSPSATVAPLRGLRPASLLVVAPFSLSRQVLAAVAGQPGVTGTEPIEAAKIKINGRFTAVLGVDPSTFRGYAAASTAASSRLWQGVADGGVAVSYTMGTLDRLSLGGRVTVAGQRQERLPVVAFGTVGIGGVDAVMSDPVARSLGMPAANAIVVSAPPADVAWLTGQIKRVLPRGAGVEALVTQVTRAGATAATVAEAGAAPGTTAPGISASGTIAGSASAASGDTMTTAQLITALRAAESRLGLPYVWGAAGPASFDCSGLVQWSFAQAGVSMPRVAADQARTGPAVPVSQLQPGDLLFYHTDPTDPGYISHVAIYLGSGSMIEAPEPGMDVHVVPADVGSQFAGAVRVDPRLAAALASGLA